MDIYTFMFMYACVCVYVPVCGLTYNFTQLTVNDNSYVAE